MTYTTNLGLENQMIDLSKTDLLKIYGGLEKQSLVQEMTCLIVIPEKTTNVRVIWAH